MREDRGLVMKFSIERADLVKAVAQAQSVVDRLRAEHGIYLLRSGRMCVAGLNKSNVGVVASAVAAVLK